MSMLKCRLHLSDNSWHLIGMNFVYILAQFILMIFYSENKLEGIEKPNEALYMCKTFNIKLIV